MRRLAHMLPVIALLACASSTPARQGPPAAQRVPDAAARPEPSSGRTETKTTSPETAPASGLDWVAKYHQENLLGFEKMLATHDFTDGIDRAEAEALGEAYFLMKFGACGVTEPPRDGGTEWLIRPRVGVAGTATEDFIRIDKRSGAIRYGDGASTEAKAALEFERNLLRRNLEEFSRRN